MKRITLAAATALMLVGPMAATASAQTVAQLAGGQARGDRDNDRGRGDRDNRGDRDDNRGRGDRDDNRGRGDRDDNRGRGDHRGDNRGNDRGDRYDRDDRRGDRADNRWNDRRHNGYTYNGRWYQGPPPAHYQNRRGYEAGYRAWRRGDRLPSYYQSRYRAVDYRHRHLRAPPRGYRYVEDDRGDLLLVGIATGVILSIILSQ